MGPWHAPQHIAIGIATYPRVDWSNAGIHWSTVTSAARTQGSRLGFSMSPSSSRRAAPYLRCPKLGPATGLALPHLHRDSAHCWHDHDVAGRLTPATFPRLPHLHRDWAHPATSAPGLPPVALHRVVLLHCLRTVRELCAQRWLRRSELVAAVLCGCTEGGVIRHGVHTQWQQAMV